MNDEIERIIYNLRKQIDEIEKQKDNQIKHLEKEVFDLKVSVHANKEVFELFKKNINKLDKNSNRIFWVGIISFCLNMLIFMMVFIILGTS